MEKAIKKNKGKPELHLLPPEVLIQVAKTLTYGKYEKYDEYNYKKGAGLKYSDLFDATLRHIMKFWSGQDFNLEDGDGTMHHLDNAIASLMMLKDLINSNKGIDDRWKNE